MAEDLEIETVSPSQQASGSAIPGNGNAKARPTKTPPRAFASLRHRNFQLYFGGQLISVAGSWMQIVAQGWLVYQISHSEMRWV